LDWDYDNYSREETYAYTGKLAIYLVYSFYLTQEGMAGLANIPLQQFDVRPWRRQQHMT
jgi:hypothetical protein